MTHIIYFDKQGKPHEAQEVQHNADETINLIYKTEEFRRMFVFDKDVDYPMAYSVPAKSAETIDASGRAINCFKVV